MLKSQPVENLVFSDTGLVHLVAACVALISGALVLFLPKATRLHIRIGYVYFAAMLVMLVTSFSLYHLFGSFGMFHWLAVVSSVTLLAGMIPVWFRRSIPNWAAWHFSFMYWSVVGLYCAFAAETFVRLPQSPFFAMVGIGSGLVGGIGAYFFRKNKDVWEAQYAARHVANP